MTNVLFFCSKNELRSPTAEAVFSTVENWNVYSAGVSHDAEVHVSGEDIEWADYIFVMEKSHKKKLSARFSRLIKNQKVISLDIPDDFEYMDETLITILKDKVPRLVG